MTGIITRTKARSREHVVSGVYRETLAFLNRRHKKASSAHSAVSMNVNPFMMAALSDFHQFDRLEDMAAFSSIAHAASGHATGFGKMIDEKILPNVFGTDKLDKKYRNAKKLTAKAYDEIDHVVFGEDGTFSLLSLKAGPWTIQHATATNMHDAFGQLSAFQQFGNEIVVGVFYGRKKDLTNKYDIVRGVDRRHQNQTLNLATVHVLVGIDFWAWINGGIVETQEWVLEGILKASKTIATTHNLTKLFDPTCIASQVASKYGLNASEQIDWTVLLRAVNAPICGD